MRATILILAASTMLTGCVVPTGPVEVTRFNRLADGQSYGAGTYRVELADADDDAKAPLSKADPSNTEPKSEVKSNTTNLSLSPYVAAVQREMNQLGYRQTSDASSKYTASIRVRVNNRIVQGRSPVSVGLGGGTGGYRGGGVGLGVGLNLGGGDKPRQTTRLSVRIRDNENGDIVWEGKASQDAGKGTPAAQPGIAASKLAEALFSGFPGQNGETITVE